jgi:fatty acid synthase
MPGAAPWPVKKPCGPRGAALHNCERQWERPEEFRPERWEDPQAEYWLGGGAAGGNARGGGGGASGQGLELLEDEEALRVDAARPPKRFMPFAGGVRNCIGQNLAKMNAHATLALLLSRFTFRLPPEVRAAACRACRACCACCYAALAGLAPRLVGPQHLPSFCPAPKLQLMGPGAIWDIHVNRLSMQPRDGLPMRCIPRPGTPATAT